VTDLNNHRLGTLRAGLKCLHFDYSCVINRSAPALQYHDENRAWELEREDEAVAIQAAAAQLISSHLEDTAIDKYLKDIFGSTSQ